MKIKNRNKFFKIVALLFVLLLPKKIFAQWDVQNLNQFGLSGAPISGIASGIVTWLLGILEMVCLIAFIIAGTMYLTAAGDDTKAEKAKKAMEYSIIGAIVGLSGFVILQAVRAMLGGTSMF